MNATLDKLIDWLWLKRDVLIFAVGVLLLGGAVWFFSSGCSLIQDAIVGGVVSQDQSQTTINGNVYDPWIARILAVATNTKEALFLILAYVVMHRWKFSRRLLNRVKGKQDLNA